LKATSFYSQNFEDVLLARCFAHLDHGFYIDVGAQDEEADSVTRYFYERGWEGINIEPVSEFAESFRCRDRDVTINCAAGSEESIQPMSVSLHSGLSSFSEKNAKSAEHIGIILEKRDIQIRSLNSIIEDLGIEKKQFEFLKIDVEGFELDVINGIDLLRYRPRIILCEVTEPNTLEKVSSFHAICRAIECQGYEKVYYDGLNQWWCEKAFKHELAEYFVIPPGVFDSTLITPYSSTYARKECRRLMQELNESQEMLNESQEKLFAAIRTLNGIYSSRGWKLMQLLRRFKLAIANLRFNL
jgi:FkbM family methyltransferase